MFIACSLLVCIASRNALLDVRPCPASLKPGVYNGGPLLRAAENSLGSPQSAESTPEYLSIKTLDPSNYEITLNVKVL